MNDRGPQPVDDSAAGRRGPSLRRRLQVTAGWAALAAFYFVAGKLGLKLAFVHASATAVWPPTGIALAAFLLFGPRFWSAILAGAFLVNVTTAGSLLTSAGIAAGNTLEGLCAAWLVQRFAAGAQAFDRPRDVFRFAGLAGLMSTAVSASFGVTSLVLGGFASAADASSIWLTWWLGDVGGALIVAPLLILWGRDPRPQWTGQRTLELACLAVSLAFVGLSIFGGWLPIGTRPVEFLSLPFLLWAAFRFGQREAAGATALLSAIAIWGVLHGFGPFARTSPNESLLLLQAFMATSSVTTLAVAAAVAQRRRAENALARSAAIVESSDDAIIGKGLDGAIRNWNAGAERLYGYSAAEVVGRNVSILIPRGRPDETPGILEKVRRGERVEPYETLRARRDGLTVAVSLAVSPVRNAHGTIVGAAAIARDVTARKRAEQRLATQFAVTRVLADSSGLRDAAPRLLQAVCEGLGWDAAELWRAQGAPSALRREAVWPAPRAGSGATVREAAFPPGTDLAGRVWESGRGEWIDDLADDPRLLRASDTLGDGLRAALAVPVRSEGQVVGVLAFFSREARTFGPDLLETAGDVASRMGQFLERARALAGLRRLEKAVATLELGVTITDMQGRILYTNPAEAAQHGYRVEELIGRHVGVFMPDAWEPAAGRPDGLRSWRRETVNVRRDGTLFPVQLLSDAITDAGGTPIGIVTCCEEISERKLAEERVEFHAYHDPLTGLPNRAYLRDRMHQALALARRNGRGLALTYLDLDRFKSVNDTLGHAVGDRLLQEVAGRLKECVREDDTVARVGGDEFVLLLPSVRHAEGAARIARKLLDRIEEPFRVDTHELYVTASAGIALFPLDGDDEEALLKNADSAMYRAKEQGRNGYLLCDAAAERHVLARLSLHNRLRRALDRGEMSLVYQPQVALDSGRIVGTEALLRWHDPENGVVLPADFVPLAEDSGLIVRLGDWALTKACTRARDWQLKGLPLVRVAVNLSVRQLRRPDLRSRVERILEETSLDPRQLDLEITETAAMQNFDSTVPVLRDFAAMGIGITIDDFGTGYSSLSYLKVLPARRLKIDRSFVAGIGREPRDTAIVKAVVRMGHSLGLSVIAEGVETEAQKSVLKQLHCDEMQGFIFSPALPGEGFERLLASSTA